MAMTVHTYTATISAATHPRITRGTASHVDPVTLLRMAVSIMTLTLATASEECANTDFIACTGWTTHNCSSQRTGSGGELDGRMRGQTKHSSNN